MGKEIKITPDAPKNENELTQMIMMGKSIHSIWIKNIQTSVTLFFALFSKLIVYKCIKYILHHVQK